MFCTSCGKQVPGETKFCTNCGALISRVDPLVAQAPALTATTNPGPVPAPAAAPEPASGVPTIAIVLLVIAGLVVLLIVGGFFAFRSGALDGLLGARSGASTGTNSKSSASDPNDKDAGGTDKDAGVAGDSGTETLTPQKSYAFLAEQWTNIQTLSAEYGDRTSGWLTDSYSPLVTATDPAVRERLAAEGGDWVDSFKQIQAALTDAKLDPSYDAERQEQLDIINALVTRAESYFAAASASVENPDESYWRPYQAPANDQAQVVRDLMAAYTPPVAP